MPYTNPRGLAVTDIGPTLTTLCAYTRADYTSGGTATPAEDDIVTFSATGNWYVKRAADNAAAKLGQVVKVEKEAAGTDVGYVTIEWLDVIRFVECAVDDLTTVTLGNAALKDGADSVANNMDAPAGAGSNLIVVAKSGTSGAGTFVAALVGG